VWAAEPASPPPAAKAAVSPAGPKASHVRGVQQALLEAGYDPGPIDGIMGPKTTSALKDFQKKEGLQVTGRLNAETQARLERRTGM